MTMTGLMLTRALELDPVGTPLACWSRLTWLKHGEGRQNPISEGSTHWRRRLKDGKNLHGD